MQMREKVLKGSFVLILGDGVAYGASFVRNMILARLLLKADFGVAAVFAMFISILEFTSKLAVGHVVVQDKDGDKPTFLATAHFVQFVAAILSALCMLLLSGTFAAALGLSEKLWAFHVLALTPLFKGLEHLDVRRMGRELRFVPAVMVEVIPQVLITLATWPLGLWLHDYRVVLVLLLGKVLFTCAGSHLLAEKPYRWKFERTYVARILRLGWPLVVNSFLLFGIYQGDQLLVGAYYSMSDLAIYFAASSVAMAPTIIAIQVIAPIMLPIMSEVQNERRIFHRRYRLCVQLVSACSMFYVLFVISGAEHLMILIFGEKYAGGGLVLAWLAAANAFRLIRAASATAAFAKADTQNQMISNLLRLTSLILVFWVALAKQPIWVLAAAGLTGELLASIFSFWRLSKRDNIPWLSSLVPAGLVAGATALSGMGVAVGVHNWHWAITLCFALVLGSLGACLLISVFPESRHQAHFFLQTILINFRRLRFYAFGNRN